MKTLNNGIIETLNNEITEFNDDVKEGLRKCRCTMYESYMR